MFRIVETLTGISLPLSAQIGPGLRIYHFGNIFIHSNVIMGRNCTLRHGATMGNRSKDGGVPTVGDGVEFGVGAVAIGPIHIGSGAKIAPLSFVSFDVPHSESCGKSGADNNANTIARINLYIYRLLDTSFCIPVGSQK